MDKRWILVDRDSGLCMGWYFWLRVLDEVNRSARYGAPFGLLLLDAHAPEGASRHAVDEAVSAITGAIRATDLGGLLGRGSAAVLLPEQGAGSAAAATSRILERLKPRSGGVTWTQRLLSYPGDAAEISHLLTSNPTDEAGVVAASA